ncbi:uncharacterized protein LOC141892208 isoform X4 [Acropora palmata]|uniref:uncharacterized protein LOC141892208 isoform X4 n=1 Tax=Acropora palmata TaxID=6131 RepID=UPI003D9FE06A
MLSDTTQKNVKDIFLFVAAVEIVPMLKERLSLRFIAGIPDDSLDFLKISRIRNLSSLESSSIKKLEPM